MQKYKTIIINVVIVISLVTILFYLNLIDLDMLTILFEGYADSSDDETSNDETDDAINHSEGNNDSKNEDPSDSSDPSDSKKSEGAAKQEGDHSENKKVYNKDEQRDKIL